MPGFDIRFPEDVRVKRITILQIGRNYNRQLGLVGVVFLFNRDGRLLGSKPGKVDRGLRDLVLEFDSAVSGVRLIRFTSQTMDGGGSIWPAIQAAELRVEEAL